MTLKELLNYNKSIAMFTKTITVVPQIVGQNMTKKVCENDTKLLTGS